MLMKRENWKELGVDILVDIAASILIAVGVYNFALHANFPVAGFSGIAIICYHLFKIPVGIGTILLNIPVAIFCYKFLGKNFFLKSVKSMIISSAFIDYVAPLFPVYEGDRMLAALCTGGFAGLGYAIIYLRESSTGGSDFILMAIKEIRPNLSIGKISFLMETVIIVLGTVTVSKSIDGLIYGMLISFIMSVVIDKVMYGISAGKLALIVTDYPEEISAGIQGFGKRQYVPQGTERLFR